MTVDVYVECVKQEFLDEIDEIIEDTMVEIFILHPRSESELEEVKAQAKAYNAIFYCAPLSLKESCDEGCVAYFVDDYARLGTEITQPLFVNAETLDEEHIQTLKEGGYRGIILNATTMYEELNDFFVAIGPSNISSFDMAILANASMDRFVLQSAYPHHDFEDIFSSVKEISNALLRPEESIISRATRHSLILFGFKKA